jgi:alcohol dehydrogenase (quinone), cytochrome c subunit
MKIMKITIIRQAIDAWRTARPLRLVPVVAVAAIAMTGFGQSAHAAASASGDASLIARGEYLARIGDCVACHTASGGKPFAGGLPIQTPLGTVYSTNISPDTKTGIGGWQYNNFVKLMRRGETRGGYVVYPAMPYPSYARMSDDDMRALYAYFMLGVQPVNQPNRQNGIPWPLSMRWPLKIWQWIFAPEPAPFTAPAGADPVIARGAYIVQGLGHCGSCHTPRGLGMQERALTDVGNTVYLSGGGIIDGWVAPSLRNEHGGGLANMRAAELVTLLKSGRNTSTASFGSMNDVVGHSLQYLNDFDLMSVATYLKSLPPNGVSAQPYRYNDAVSNQLLHGNVSMAGRGSQLYLDRCAGCHRSDGRGNGNAFPALAGNPVLQTSDPTSVIHIVLSGSAMPATRAAPSTITMGPYADILSNEQIAEVATFVQTSWGNKGGPATASQVEKIRRSAKPVQPETWTNVDPVPSSCGLR